LAKVDESLTDDEMLVAIKQQTHLNDANRHADGGVLKFIQLG
jgi:hypothetical protein